MKVRTQPMGWAGKAAIVATLNIGEPRGAARRFASPTQIANEIDRMAERLARRRTIGQQPSCRRLYRQTRSL
jgi:hypothetical protein